MEDVLDVYERPYIPAFPVVCFDETSKQLVDHANVPVPAQRGKLRRVDDEYRRRGTANIFVAVEPLTGKVVLQATEHRASTDCAKFLKRLIDTEYGQATKLVIVMDNLSTHTPACFYEAFEPAEARRLTEKLELHYTPRHGSWLNVAEMQISVIARQCLDRRIASLSTLRCELRAWKKDHNPNPVSWQFSNAQARIKLRHLYPSTQ